MIRWQTIFVSFVILSAGSAAESAAPPEASQIAALVRQLGSDDFHVREQASRRLLQIGLPAKQALQKGAKDVDLEIRRRCHDLLPAIMEADRQAKFAALLTDKDDKHKHDLPGWQRYRKIVGADAAAKEFFVAMQKADTGILGEIDKDPAEAGKRCGNLCQQLTQYRRDEKPLTEFALLLFVAGDSRVAIPFQQHYLFNSLFYQTPVRNELRNGRATPFRKIVLAWMERQVKDEQTAANLFGILNNLELKEGPALALKAIRGKKLKGSAVAYALVTVGKLGDKNHVPMLESYLDDKTQVSGFGIGVAGGKGVSGTTEVRDAALSMLVHVTKQSHAEYGFALSKAKNPSLMFNAAFLGFSSAGERDKAFAKWKKWKAAQKK